MEIIFGKNHAHGLLLFQTDAVLAGYGSPQFNAGFHDFPAGFFDPVQLIRIPGIKQQQGMQVPVPGMEHVAVFTIVFFGYRGHRGQGLRQLGSGHGSVIDQIVGCQPRNRAEGAAPALPQTVALIIVFGFLNCAAIGLHANFPDALSLLFEAGRRPFHLNDQHRGGIPGIAASITVFHRFDNHGIHHFQGGG